MLKLLTRYQDLQNLRSQCSRLLLLSSLLLLHSCYSLTLQTVHYSPVYLNQPQIIKQMKSVQVLRHMYYETSVDYIFGSHPRENTFLSEILQQELKADEGVINLHVQQSPSPLDMAVTVLSLGIYSRSKLIVEGDVIRVAP